MAFLLSLTDLAVALAGVRPSITTSSVRRASSIRVCAATDKTSTTTRTTEKESRNGQERVIRVSDPIRDPLSVGSLISDSTEVVVRSRDEEKRDERQRYYVNMGYAIRTLREEFPETFYKEPTFDIYRDDITFKDPFNTFVGIENYKRIFWALRFIGRIFFKALWIDIVSIWQPMGNVVMIRWVVHGIPRVPWESHGRFDATSEYKLDKNGKIYQHKVDNVALNLPMKFRVLPVEELIRSLGCPSTPKPTCFETSSVEFTSLMPVLLRFTWTRWYLSLYLALAAVSAAGG